MSLADLFRDELAREFQQRLTRPSDEAAEKTNDNAQKLETAADADLFKYFLLINVAGIAPSPSSQPAQPAGPGGPDPSLWFQTGQLFGPGNCTLGASRAGSAAWK